MGALYDAFNDKVMKNQMNNLPPSLSLTQLPASSPVPTSEAEAYRQAINTPFTVQPTPQVQDIYTAAAKANTDAGGGWGGAGLAVLAGLGKLGQVIHTSTGNKLLAGMAGNPYLAEGYLNNANTEQAQEMANKNMVFQGNLDKMKAQGEDVKTGEQISAENQRANAANNLAAQTAMIASYFKSKGIQVDEDRINADLIKFQTGQNQETQKFNAQQTQSAQEKTASNRPWYSKLFGGDEIKPSIVSVNNNQPDTKTIGNITYTNIGGKWYAQ